MSVRETKIANHNLTLVLLNATVIHSNKYVETKVSGGGNVPVNTQKTLHTDVVFRLTLNGRDLSQHIQDFDFPLYTGQIVDLIVGNNLVIGYKDIQTNTYYVTSKNPARDLKFIFNSAIVWIAGIVAAIFLYIVIGLDSRSVFKDYYILKCSAPFILFMTVYQIYKFSLNSDISTEIDKLIKNK